MITYTDAMGIPVPENHMKFFKNNQGELFNRLDRASIFACKFLSIVKANVSWDTSICSEQVFACYRSESKVIVVHLIDHLYGPRFELFLFHEFVHLWQDLKGIIYEWHKPYKTRPCEVHANKVANMMMLAYRKEG